MLTRLPIDPMLPKVSEALSQYRSIILKASPGAGKTTRVPSHLLTASWLGSKKILVLEPRRLAAKLSAIRVAQERNSKLGEEVGYEFRFERKSSKSSRLVFLTEGLLMRKFLTDPELSDVGIVILDEFHERHVHADIALSLLKNLQQKKRPDLRIVVMSATMDTAQLSAFLPDAPVLNQEIPPHPLEIAHLEAQETFLEKKCVKAVRLALESKYKGDILVFLPGMGEIRKTENAILDQRLANCRTYILHSEISPEEQEAALSPQKGIRKIILSTNIAETSVTIEGVNIVIDSGLEKRATVDEWTQITELQTKKISQASARQRMGRAARTEAGFCIRLYSKADFDALLPFTPPEIQRSDLTRTYLELLAVGIEDLATFPWYEAPRENLLSGSRQLLLNLGAIHSNGKITDLGKQMAQIPTSPRISRVLIEAAKRNVLTDCAWLVAGVTEGQLKTGDAYSQLPELKRNSFLRKTVNQLMSATSEETLCSSDEETLANCFLQGFSDRIGKRKPDQSTKYAEYVVAAGGVVQLEKEKAPSTPFLLILDAKKNDFGKTFAQAFFPLTLDQIFDELSEQITEKTHSHWDRDKQRIVSQSQLVLGNLIMTESKISAKDGETARVLMREGLGISPHVKLSLKEICEKLNPWDASEAFSAALSRIELFQNLYANAEYTTINAENFLLFLESELQGKDSLQSLKELDWKNDLYLYFLKNQFPKLEQKLPEFIQVSNGRRIKLTYALGSAPKTSIKMQELFGVKQLPTIADGKLNIQLEILGPNFRPVQVTSDLAGFWERSYPALRKELSRKYPRHKWPEDPLTALPPDRKK